MKHLLFFRGPSGNTTSSGLSLYSRSRSETPRSNDHAGAATTTTRLYSKHTISGEPIAEIREAIK